MAEIINSIITGYNSSMTVSPVNNMLVNNLYIHTELRQNDSVLSCDLQR